MRKCVGLHCKPRGCFWWTLKHSQVHQKTTKLRFHPSHRQMLKLSSNFGSSWGNCAIAKSVLLKLFVVFFWTTIQPNLLLLLSCLLRFCIKQSACISFRLFNAPSDSVFTVVVVIAACCIWCSICQFANFVLEIRNKKMSSFSLIQPQN